MLGGHEEDVRRSSGEVGADLHLERVIGESACLTGIHEDAQKGVQQTAYILMSQ